MSLPTPRDAAPGDQVVPVNRRRLFLLAGGLCAFAVIILTVALINFDADSVGPIVSAVVILTMTLAFLRLGLKHRNVLETNRQGLRLPILGVTLDWSNIETMALDRTGRIPRLLFRLYAPESGTSAGRAGRMGTLSAIMSTVRQQTGYDYAVGLTPSRLSPDEVLARVTTAASENGYDIPFQYFQRGDQVRAPETITPRDRPRLEDEAPALPPTADAPGLTWPALPPTADAEGRDWPLLPGTEPGQAGERAWPIVPEAEEGRP